MAVKQPHPDQHGRGGLVDPSELVSALSSGWIAGAGLDVFEIEPLSSTDPLLGFLNVVVIPYVAGLTTGTFDRSFALAAENCHRIASGAPIAESDDLARNAETGLGGNAANA